MGRLSSLSKLDLNGLKNLKDPPIKLQKDCHNCIRYLSSKLLRTKRFYRMKLMLIGCAKRGKTTLVTCFQGKEHGHDSVGGMHITDWSYRPSIGRTTFHFSIWDYSGEDEYYLIHQCFLSQHSLYLLFFNLKHGDKGVQELKPWLDSLAIHTPDSSVIIVGTHLDEIPDEERKDLDALLHHVVEFTSTYKKKLQIMDVIPVGLKNVTENVSYLKKVIYYHVANYKNQAGQVFMGQKIPASYHAVAAKSSPRYQTKYPPAHYAC